MQIRYSGRIEFTQSRHPREITLMETRGNSATKIQFFFQLQP